MLIDAREVPNGLKLETEVCIVGGGAAGISLACEFNDREFRTVLLESGGYTSEAKTQALYKGEIIGHPIRALDVSRLRFLGGTTNHWGGMCIPLEAIDFEERPWVPHSGWPIGLADLEPFYPRAQELCELGPYDYRLSYWMPRRGKQSLPIGNGPIVSRIAQFSRPPTRFGERYRKSLESSTSVSTYLHANVLEFEPDASGRTIKSVKVGVLDGGNFTISAKVFVLAAGAIENARILLLSRAASEAGLGNRHDLVGRYFMEHLDYPGGDLFVPVDDALWKPFFEQDRLSECGINGFLGTDFGWQRRSGVLNSSMHLHVRAPDEPGSIGARVWDAISGLWNQSRPDVQSSATVFDIRHIIEPAPNPNSRVRLGKERDKLGQPRVQLDWRLTPEIEGATVRRVLRSFAEQTGQLGLGRVRMGTAEKGDEWTESVIGSFHHMGTTRMHTDPRQGVVDENCRVHGIANLYVSGSSVFPTAGQVNPTLTIVALALRLGDQIVEEFS